MIVLDASDAMQKTLVIRTAILGRYAGQVVCVGCVTCVYALVGDDVGHVLAYIVLGVEEYVWVTASFCGVSFEMACC